MKINFDAAVSRGFGSAVALCRDQFGLHLGSVAFVIRGMFDPSILEAIVCQEDLSLAKDLGLQNLCNTSNCKTVVKHIRESSGSSYGVLVIEIRSWKNTFVSCDYVHESRSSFFEAHSLARHALLLDQGRHLWMGQPHDPNIIHVSLPIDQ